MCESNNMKLMEWKQTTESQKIVPKTAETVSSTIEVVKRGVFGWNDKKKKSMLIVVQQKQREYFSLLLKSLPWLTKIKNLVCLPQ